MSSHDPNQVSPNDGPLLLSKTQRDCHVEQPWRWITDYNRTDAARPFETKIPLPARNGMTTVLDLSWTVKNAAGDYVPSVFRVSILSNAPGKIAGPPAAAQPEATDLSTPHEKPIFVGDLTDAPKEVFRFAQGVTVFDDSGPAWLYMRVITPTVTVATMGYQISWVPRLVGEMLSIGEGGR